MTRSDGTPAAESVSWTQEITSSNECTILTVENISCGCMCADCRWGTHCDGIYCDNNVRDTMKSNGAQPLPLGGLACMCPKGTGNPECCINKLGLK